MEKSFNGSNKPAPDWDLEEVRRIVLEGLRGHPVKVFLFGSRALGTMQRYSDIDVGVLADEQLPPGTLAGIQ